VAKTRRVAARRFYSNALDAAERAGLPEALQVDGIDEEIAVLRLRLRRAIEEHPDDLPLMFRGIDLLARVVAARYRLSRGSKEEIEAQVAASLRELTGDLFPEGSGDE
jgi:hypothetical protein